MDGARCHRCGHGINLPRSDLNRAAGAVLVGHRYQRPSNPPRLSEAENAGGWRSGGSCVGLVAGREWPSYCMAVNELAL